MTAPTGLFRREVTAAYRHPLIWLARDLTIDARTGQAGTLTRTTTKAVPDSGGTNRTVNHSQPGWVGNTAVPSLDLGASESLQWAFSTKPTAMCGLIDFYENGTLASAGLPLLTICGATFLAPTLYLDVSAGLKYQITHNNNVSSVTATLAAAPTSGQRVQIRWWLYSDGKVQLWQSINGAAETTPGASGTLALASAWNGTPALYLNAKAVSSYGANRFIGCVVMLGNQSQAKLLEALT